MQLKPGVDFTNIDPHLQEAVSKLDCFFRHFLDIELVITAGRDGKHKPNSLHYQGKAADIRVWNVLDAIRQRMKTIVGPDFDLLLERDPPHYHIEYDPKA